MGFRNDFRSPIIEKCFKWSPETFGGTKTTYVYTWYSGVQSHLSRTCTFCLLEPESRVETVIIKTKKGERERKRDREGEGMGEVKGDKFFFPDSFEWGWDGWFYNISDLKRKSLPPTVNCLRSLHTGGGRGVDE